MLGVQFAMRGEAAPFLARGSFERLPATGKLGFELYRGTVDAAEPLLVGVAGSHPRFGVDCIGSVPASLLAHTLLEGHGVRQLINAGTAGGFEARGGRIGDVYLGAETSVFHDRRVPLPGFEAMGRGHFPIRCDRALAERHGWKVGTVSTGDSLDCTPEDATRMSALGASVKEMEAAAIAWVCEQHAVPLLLLKALTDIVDHPASTSEQFLANYDLAVGRLTDALVALVRHLQGSGSSYA